MLWVTSVSARASAWPAIQHVVGADRRAGCGQSHTPLARLARLLAVKLQHLELQGIDPCEILGRALPPVGAVEEFVRHDGGNTEIRGWCWRNRVRKPEWPFMRAMTLLPSRNSLEVIQCGTLLLAWLLGRAAGESSSTGPMISSSQTQSRATGSRITALP